MRLPSLVLLVCLGCGDTSANRGFQSFRLFMAGGLCEPNDDCASSIELSSDGTLLVDRWGEFPVVVHEATVASVDLAAAVPVLTNPALVALLDGPVLLCSQVFDYVVFMEVVLADGVHQGNVTTCQDPPIQAALDAMEGLAETYLPED
jgi:hypothetical protein